MRSRAVVVVMFAAVVLLGFGSALAVAAESGQDRVIKDGRISESSGLAASFLHPGVLWTHNDSGHPPRIFAISRDGTTATTITVAGEDARDWEAITSLRKPVKTGQPYIAIGDIGDNNSAHTSGRIIILPEPRNLVAQTVRPQRVIRFEYPDAPHNAEALLADPRTGRLYVVTKDLFSSQIFVVRDSAWPGQTKGVSGLVTLELVATSTASLITDGTFLPDGRMLLRGYDRLFLLPPPERATNGKLTLLESVQLPEQEQGESLTTVDDGKTALIGSEGNRQPVLRLDLNALGITNAGSTTGSRNTTQSGPSPDPGEASGTGITGSENAGEVGMFGISLNPLVAGAALGALTLLVSGIVRLAISRR